MANQIRSHPSNQPFGLVLNHHSRGKLLIRFTSRAIAIVRIWKEQQQSSSSTNWKVCGQRLAAPGLWKSYHGKAPSNPQQSLSQKISLFGFPCQVVKSQWWRRHQAPCAMVRSFRRLSRSVSWSCSLSVSSVDRPMGLSRKRTWVSHKYLQCNDTIHDQWNLWGSRFVRFVKPAIINLPPWQNVFLAAKQNHHLYCQWLMTSSTCPFNRISAATCKATLHASAARTAMAPLQLAMRPRRLDDAARRVRDNGHVELKLLMQLPWKIFMAKCWWILAPFWKGLGEEKLQYFWGKSNEYMYIYIYINIYIYFYIDIYKYKYR